MGSLRWTELPDVVEHYPLSSCCFKMRLSVVTYLGLIRLNPLTFPHLYWTGEGRLPYAGLLTNAGLGSCPSLRVDEHFSCYGERTVFSVV